MKKKIVSLLLAGIVILPSTAFAYKDISNHWAKTYIEDMEYAGVLNQFSSSNIIPDQPATREECAVLISDFAEVYFGYKPTFKKDNYKFMDLRDGENANKIRALSLLTYKSYMTSPHINYPYASESKIIDGYPGIGNNIEFKPNNNVTRAEFSKMLVNAIDCFGYMGVGNYPLFASDADYHWGRNYMALAQGYEIIHGYSKSFGKYKTPIRLEDGTFGESEVDFFIELKPEGNITRAEAIKMVACTRGLSYIGLMNESYETSRPSGEKELYYLSE